MCWLKLTLEKTFSEAIPIEWNRLPFELILTIIEFLRCIKI